MSSNKDAIFRPNISKEKKLRFVIYQQNIVVYNQNNMEMQIGGICLITIKNFCEGIGLNEEVSGQVYAYKMDNEVYANFRKLFQEDKKCFMEEIESREDEHMFALALYCRLGTEAYKEYKERGISDEIYFDTFSDFRIWSDACMRKYHVTGLMEYGWLCLPLELKIFRLGRLQFEPTETEEDIEVNGTTVKAGTKVLEVHIPEGRPLNDEECEESFGKADEFFGREYEAYICTSWLVAPEIKKIVSSESNIAKFQDRFEVYEVIYPFRQAEERVFGEILEDRTLYKEQTSLQRALKKYVADGKDPGMGRGIIYR